MGWTTLHKPRGTTPRQVIHEALGVGDLRRPSQEQLDALPPGAHGWDIPWRDRPVVGHRKVLADSFGLRVAYLAVEDTFLDGRRETWIAVYLLGHYPKDPYYNFGYKDICESMGPCERSCPEKVLRAVDPFPLLLCSDEEYQVLRAFTDAYSPEDVQRAVYAWAAFQGFPIPYVALLEWGLVPADRVPTYEELVAAGQAVKEKALERLRHVDGGHGYARQWRADCWANINEKKARPVAGKGTVLKFETPIAFRDYSRDTLVYTGKGNLFTAPGDLWQRYRVSRWRERKYSVAA